MRGKKLKIYQIMLTSTYKNNSFKDCLNKTLLLVCLVFKGKELKIVAPEK